MAELYLLGMKASLRRLATLAAGLAIKAKGFGKGFPVCGGFGRLRGEDRREEVT